MERTRIEDPGETDRTGQWSLTNRLGTTNLAVNYYRLEPGDGLPGGLHAHADQEEVFFVIDGQATFETYGTVDEGEGTDGDAVTVDEGEGTDGDAVTVDEGEAVRFGPGEYQSGRNAGDEDLVVLALGAPRDTEDVRVPVACPDCGHDDLRIADGGRFVCPACGTERVPAPCPDCESEDLALTVIDGEPVAVCRDCGEPYDRPPMAD